MIAFIINSVNSTNPIALKKYLEYILKQAIEKIAVIVPTLNAGELWKTWIVQFQKQNIKLQQIIIIDSESDDETCRLTQQADPAWEIVSVSRDHFNHGATRQFATTLLKDPDYIVFMTQDAILESPDSIQTLISAFDDATVGLAYGRQLPRKQADPLEKLARKYNYPPHSETRSTSDSKNSCIKTTMFSNSFSAYRSSTFHELGGFSSLDFGEDMDFAARALTAGWKLRYQADAKVIHSHPSGIREDYRRGRAIGEFHKNDREVLKNFGKAEGAGRKFFIFAMMSLIRQRNFLWLFATPFYFGAKYLGYKIGKLK